MLKIICLNLKIQAVGSVRFYCRGSCAVVNFHFYAIFFIHKLNFKASTMSDSIDFTKYNLADETTPVNALLTAHFKR